MNLFLMLCTSLLVLCGCLGAQPQLPTRPAVDVDANNAQTTSEQQQVKDCHARGMTYEKDLQPSCFCPPDTRTMQGNKCVDLQDSTSTAAPAQLIEVTGVLTTNECSQVTGIWQSGKCFCRQGWQYDEDLDSCVEGAVSSVADTSTSPDRNTCETMALTNPRIVWDAQQQLCLEQQPSQDSNGNNTWKIIGAIVGGIAEGLEKRREQEEQTN